ncbi:MAG TPA: RnfABCDGE type electron transport complex subunit D [Sedimentisphaerales bacterium]|nr:RnfABCDGE type electron transport complex subunit D [Sedimentisphaerales bacterium]
MLSEITVSPAPHISKQLSTRSVMVDVIIGLVPAMAAAGYYFRLRAFVLIAACVISAVVTEWLCNVIRKRPDPLESLGDFSAVVTGIILAMSVPPRLPIWAAVIGAAFSIAIGKMVFGGLGANIFNPAMVGRAFLTASFGMLMTTWTVPGTIDAQMPKISAENKLDARTQATPLAWSKQQMKADKQARAYDREIPTVIDMAEPSQRSAEIQQKRQAYDRAKALAQTSAQAVDANLESAFTGEVGGCLGETSALALIIGGFYLLIRRTISFHIPLAVMVSAFVFAGAAYLINSDAYASPVFHLCAGGLLIGALFIATDPVTAPLSTKGMWIFGIGVGTITMLIRVVGEYPEGVMYSILLMNAVTPLIDRFCKLIPAGGKPHV